MSQYCYRANSKTGFARQLASVTLFERRALLSRLLAERSKVHLIVAPGQYGKSVLAFQFASLLSALRGILWVEAYNPNFLVMIDSEKERARFLSQAQQLDVVVIDDLPHLSEAQIKKLSRLVYVLKQAQKDVIVTTRSFEFIRYTNESVHLIQSRDLLLSNHELKNSKVHQNSQPLYLVSDIERIPSLAFSSYRDSAFVEALHSSSYTHDFELLGAFLLFVRKGSIDDIRPFFSYKFSEMLINLFKVIPHCGISKSGHTFETYRLDIENRFNLFERHLASLVNLSPFDTVNEYIRALSDVLLRCSKVRLSVALVIRFLGSRDIHSYFQRYAYRLLEHGYAKEVVTLYLACEEELHDDVESLLVYAEALADLGDFMATEGVLNRVEKLAVSDEEKLSCLCVRLRYNLVSFEQAQSATKSLTIHTDSFLVQAVDEVENQLLHYCDELIRTKNYLALHALVLYQSVGNFSSAISLLNHMCKKHCSSCLLSYSLGIFMTVFEHVKPRLSRKSLFKTSQVASLALSQIILDSKITRQEGYLVNRVKRLQNEFFEVSYPDAYFVRAKIMSERMEEQVFAHRGMYLNERHEKHIGNRRALQNEGSFLQNISAMKQKSLLIKAFGGFEVRYDENRFPSKGGVRPKAQQLLVLLLAHRGKEISRLWAQQVIWPHVREENSRQSFYNVWTYLKKLFEPFGDSKVVYSNSATVRINTDFVVSDIEIVEYTCSMLTAHKIALSEYESALMVLDEWYVGLLLPGVEIPEIDSYRKKYEQKVVDALMIGVDDLCHANDFKMALRFAQKAFFMDSAREDICYRLMGLQKKLNQYSSAMQTFLSHRDTMIELYGLDGSLRLHELYEEILKEGSQ